jgi:hypothetical protein
MVPDTPGVIHLNYRHALKKGYTFCEIMSRPGLNTCKYRFQVKLKAGQYWGGDNIADS